MADASAEGLMPLQPPQTRQGLSHQKWVRLTLFRQFFPLLPPEDAPSITRAVVLQSALAFAYTGLVALAASHPDSLGGQLLATWIAAIDHLIKLLFGLSGPSIAATAPAADGVIIYRHVLAVSLAVTAISVISTRRYRGAWAESILNRWGPSARQSAVGQRVMLVGHRLAVLGFLAATLLLIVAEYQLAEAGWPLSTQSWMLFFAPGLTSVGYWFACNAMALRGVAER